MFKTVLCCRLFKIKVQATLNYSSLKEDRLIIFNLKLGSTFANGLRWF